MNKKRKNDLLKLSITLNKLIGEIESCSSELANYAAEEEESFDSMSEKQQDSEKGNVVYENIQWLNLGVDDLTNAHEAIADLVEKIQNLES